MLFREPKNNNESICFCGYVTCYSFFAWAGNSKATVPLQRNVSMQGPQHVSTNVEASKSILSLTLYSLTLILTLFTLYFLLFSCFFYCYQSI